MLAHHQQVTTLLMHWYIQMSELSVLAAALFLWRYDAFRASHQKKVSFYRQLGWLSV